MLQNVVLWERSANSLPISTSEITAGPGVRCQEPRTGNRSGPSETTHPQKEDEAQLSGSLRSWSMPSQAPGRAIFDSKQGDLYGGRSPRW